MDNLTHSLVGILVGESCSRFVRADKLGLPASTRRSLLITLGVVGSNLPDADFLYSLVTQNKLDYLSHHRGYTHTVVGVMVGAAIAMALAELWLRWRRLQPTRGDRGLLFASVAMALSLHLAMDYTNNYGVHPFWPVYNAWLYGDSVFIIEPSLWVAAAPLVFLLRTRAARVLMALVLVAGLVLCFNTRWVLPASGGVLTLLLALLLVAGWKAPAKVALLCSLGAWLGITATFLTAHHVAARRIEAASAQQFAGATLLDRVLTPMPANPLCWNVIAVVLEADQYALRRGVLSLAPSLIAAPACPDRSGDAPTTAPLQPMMQGTGSAALQWRDEFKAPRAEMAAVARAYCDATVFMHFARTPWAARRGDDWLIGDLRYDREPGISFAELELTDSSRDCSAQTPPWAAPRGELLP